MGCKCKDREKLRRVGEPGSKLINNLATRYSRHMKMDVQVYIEDLVDGKILYNFTPYNEDTKNVINVIRWQEVEQKI